MTKRQNPIAATRDQTLRTLRRDVFWVVGLKACLILLAAFTIFGAAARLHVDADVMTTHIIR